MLKTGAECGMYVVTDLTTQDVGYSHFMIVHNGSQVVGGEKVGLEQDGVRRQRRMGIF